MLPIRSWGSGAGPGACAPSRGAAVRAVERGAVDASDLLVGVGCGPRGGPGLLRLDRLGDALRETDLDVPVLTDGLPPENAVGCWASMATPEATAGGVIGRLRGGDARAAGRAGGRLGSRRRGRRPA